MAKDRRFIQRATKRTKAVSFTQWAREHGYEGVTAEAIEAGKQAGGPIAKKANFAFNVNQRRGVNPEEFSLGGVLSQTGGGIGAGAAFGPIGAAIGGGIGLIGGLLGHSAEKKQEEQMGIYANKQQSDQKAFLDEQRSEQHEGQYLATLGANQRGNPFTATFPLGGLIPYGPGQTVEAEEGEVIDNGKGLRKLGGNKHEQGGTDITEPAGTRIYSDREIYKPTGKTFAEEADAIRKEIARLDKQLA